MSTETWKAEFYPVDASTKMTNLEAVRHSLKKWRGLTPENLARHDVNINARPDGGLAVGRLLQGEGSDGLAINSVSCALCHKHSDEFHYCRTCPITRAVGSRCDRVRFEEGSTEWTSPWHKFDRQADPMPMITLLKKAEARLLKDQARKR